MGRVGGSVGAPVAKNIFSDEFRKLRFRDRRYPPVTEMPIFGSVVFRVVRVGVFGDRIDERAACRRVGREN